MPTLPETIIGQTCECQDVTCAEIEAAAKDVKEWLKLKMTSGSCSTGLVYQLAGHYRRMPQMFCNRLLLADVHAVFDQIGKLEKTPLTRAVPTKPAEPLAGPLKGLWHSIGSKPAFWRPTCSTRPKSMARCLSGNTSTRLSAVIVGSAN